MENLNFYIKKIFFIKILGIFIILILLVGSIVIDFILFYRGEELKQAYSSLDTASNVDMNIEKQTEEINEFYERYYFIDKETFEKKLECLEAVDCNQIIFNSENSKIGFYIEDLKKLNYYVDFLEDKGFKINIVSVKKENGSTYFEMEVE